MKTEIELAFDRAITLLDLESNWDRADHDPVESRIEAAVDETYHNEYQNALDMGFCDDVARKMASDASSAHARRLRGML